MSKKPHQDKLRESIGSNLENNVDTLKEVLNLPENEDVIFKFHNAEKIRICLIYVEGLADDKKIADYILRAMNCSENITSAEMDAPVQFLKNVLIEIPQIKKQNIVHDLVQGILAGMTCVLVDGSDEALIMETRSYPSRGVQQPTNESVVYGPHEAFNENLRTNISLIRRYVQSPQLISEKMYVGKGVPTLLSIVYLKGVASESCLQEVKRRLKCIKSETVMGTGAVQQLIEDSPFALLPQMLQTERPDRAASCIEDGQIAILVENSPYALIAPVTFFHLIHASDDSFLRWQYGSALRIIRVFGLLMSLVLPALYVALTLYHVHLIPMPLLTSIAESRANVPFSIIAEVLFMEFSFYLLNEAGLRTPSQIGSAFGVVGALILGQAAVSASIISPILIIIIAITGLGNYVVPNYGLGIGLIIYRLILIALSALMGLYGLVIGLFLIITHICSIRSFGVDFLSPAAPYRRHNPDLLLRLPIWMQKYAMFFSKKNNWLETQEGKT